MPVDEPDSTAVTEELPWLGAGRVGNDPAVFAGRAQPVVLSDLELALIDEADDPGAWREWVRAAGGSDADGDGEGPVIGPVRQLPTLPKEQRPSLASLVTHGAVVVLLAIPAMLVVAFGIAAAAR